MTRRVAAAVLVLLSGTGCGGHADSNEGISGPPSEVQGWLEGVGGPAGSGPRHWHGTVTLTPDGDGNQVTTVQTDAHGRFDIPVSAGHYTLTGQSPEYGAGVCQGERRIVVDAHQTVHVDVLCQMR